MELYRVAADGGIADAMNSLGLLLEDGRGAYALIVQNDFLSACL